MKNNQSTEQTSMTSLNEAFEMLLSEQKDCVFAPTDSLAQCLRKVIKWRKWNPQKFEEHTGLTQVICSKIKRKDDFNPTIATIVAFCVGAKLSLDLANELLRKGGYALNDTRLHVAYRVLLGQGRSISIDDANQFLVNQGFKPISDKESFRN